MLAFIDRIKACRSPTQSDVRGSVYFIRSINPIFVWSETSQVLSLWCLVVHLGFDIFKMATVVLVTMKVFVNPIAMKLHRNDTWEVHMFNKYSLNYEFQNIEYQVSNGCSLAAFAWETLLWEDYVNFNWLSKRS